MLADRKPLLLSFLPPVFVTLAMLYWYTKPLAGEVFMGLCQWEQVVYLATAREFVENGRLLFYPSPYAAEGDFPRVYSHLFQIIVGYAWKFTGISLTKIWWASRLVFGPIMFYLGYQILKEFFEGTYLKIGYLMLIFGGGLAYLHAFFGSLVFGKGFIESWHLLEAPYDWWFTNLFRVTFYPLEIFVHILMFASILFFLRKQFAISAVFYFLTWWTHPLNGALLTAVYLVFFIFEAVGFGKRGLLKNAVPFLAIAGVFLYYYFAFIPSFPLANQLAENYKSASFKNMMHLNPLLYTSAWGIFIVGPLLFTRSALFDSYKKRFVLYWALVVFILLNHDVLVPQSLVHQPMHFTRGNFFFPLLILTLLGLQKFLDSSYKARAGAVLSIMLVLSLPDNVIFMQQFSSVGGDYGTPMDSKLNPLRLSESQWDITEKLNELEGERVVLSHDRLVSVVIPAYTPHRSLLGYQPYSPNFDSKLHDARLYFKTTDQEILKRYGITVVIFQEHFEKIPMDGEVYYENSDLVIWVRTT